MWVLRSPPSFVIVVLNFDAGSCLSSTSPRLHPTTPLARHWRGRISGSSQFQSVSFLAPLFQSQTGLTCVVAMLLAISTYKGEHRSSCRHLLSFSCTDATIVLGLLSVYDEVASNAIRRRPTVYVINASFILSPLMMNDQWSRLQELSAKRTASFASPKGSPTSSTRMPTSPSWIS